MTFPMVSKCRLFFFFWRGAEGWRGGRAIREAVIHISFYEGDKGVFKRSENKEYISENIVREAKIFLKALEVICKGKMSNKTV